MQIYILVNGEQQGPFSVHQLKGYIAMGQFQDTDLAWHEGMADWRPLKEFPEFAPRAHRTPNYKGIPVRQFVQKKQKRSKSGLLSGVLAFVVLAAAGAGGYYYWHKQQQRKAAAAAAAAAANAPQAPTGPTTLAELNQSYAEPPAGQNAATFFQQGADALQISDSDKASYSLPLVGRGSMPSPGGIVPGGVKTALKTLMERNQSSIDLFERGAQCAGSRYPVDLTRGFSLSLPHLSKVKLAAQFGELYALWQGDLHDGSGASRGVLIAVGAGRSLEPEPLLISQLTRVSAEGMAVDALEQAMNRAVLPAASLTQLRAAFDRAAQDEAAGNGFNRAYASERVNGLAVLDLAPDKLRAAFGEMAGTNALRELGGLPDKSLANVKDQRQFYEETFTQVATARNDPFPGRLKADETMASRATEARGQQYLIAALLLPAQGKLTSREASSLARLRLAQAALALESFRAAQNRYPEALTELAPKFISAVPTDPFDGQPLRYRKTPTGYNVYSIGPNLRDDGGSRAAGSDDLSFAVVRPPKAT